MWIAWLSATVALVTAETSEEVERAIAFEDLPRLVREAVTLAAGEHELVEIEEVLVDEDTFYEVEWLEDGMEVEITLTPKGDIVSREVEAPDGDDEEDDETEPDTIDD